MIKNPGTSHPEVSIILPVFNDELWISRALESCLDQTLGSIEIIVVDDASTDRTVAIVEKFQRNDDRIKVIRQPENGSAFRARRVGLENATAAFVMFLDGDDELVPQACETALRLARGAVADVVGFGCRVVSADGTTGSHYERSMQPRDRKIENNEILYKLFPVGITAQGQLWRYLFRRSLLTAAYSDLPHSLSLPRMNDLPIAFLALMRAKTYVSTSERLYRYYFHRGASGHKAITWDDYLFNVSALDSIDAISAVVANEAMNRPDASQLERTYTSVRQSVAGRVLGYVKDIDDEAVRKRALIALTERVGSLELAIAAAGFRTDALTLLMEATSPARLPDCRPGHVVLRTGNLRTGGVQGVLVAQAKHLSDSGIKVTIVLDSAPVTEFEVPEGVSLLQLNRQTLAERMSFLVDLCREESVDVVIDHHILYNERWQFFAHALSAAGIPTIGWIHNFALRPLLDNVGRLSFLEKHLPLLSTVVTLSEPDVVYWKLRGINNVVYLPNPPSPLARRITLQSELREAPSGRLEIAWWGRLQQSTKQVMDLLDLGSNLHRMGVDFAIKIIGPDGPDLGSRQLRRRALDRGISDRVDLPGPLHGAELIEAVRGAHVFVSTSIVEGYPLALVEAQALGLPVFMYDLPWLEFLRGNSGVVRVAQGDRAAMARVLAQIAEDPDQYSVLTSGALEAAETQVSHDFEDLYLKLLQGELDPQFSPAPNAESMRLLLDQNVRFVERLDRIRRREVKRRDAAAELKINRLEERINRLPEVAVRAQVDQNVPPAVPKLRSLLQRFLPATMRQAAYYARHEYRASSNQHKELIANQAKLSAQLTALQRALEANRR